MVHAILVTSAGAKLSPNCGGAGSCASLLLERLILTAHLKMKFRVALLGRGVKIFSREKLSQVALLAMRQCHRAQENAA